MKMLRPISSSRKIEAQIRKRIGDVLKKLLYEPLFEELDAKEELKAIKNAKPSALEKALRSGRVYFYRGQFKGKLNAAITKDLKRMGAKYNQKTKTYDLLGPKLPLDVKTVIDSSAKKFEQSMDKIAKKLDKVSASKISKSVDLTDLFDKQIYEVDKDFQKQISKITVTPELTVKQRAKISKEYNNNMRLYIQEWTEEEIVNLREVVTKNVNEGIRYEEIVKGIQERFGVSKSKAKFLARQETHLLVGNLSEQRYKDAGSTHYIWRTVKGSPKHPVRASHKALDGKKIAWNDPPIVTEAGQPVKRAHAGIFYGCRCNAVPLIEF